MRFERGDTVRVKGATQTGQVIAVFHRQSSENAGNEIYRMIINYGAGMSLTVTGRAQMEQIQLVAESQLQTLSQQQQGKQDDKPIGY
jgi:hypothetical protein